MAEECDGCLGSGECDQCDGSGTEECRTCYNETECSECKGSGLCQQCAKPEEETETEEAPDL